MFMLDHSPLSVDCELAPNGQPCLFSDVTLYSEGVNHACTSDTPSYFLCEGTAGHCNQIHTARIVITIIAVVIPMMIEY